MGATEDKSLTVHTKNKLTKKEKNEIFHHNKKKDKKQKNTERDASNV